MLKQWTINYTMKKNRNYSTLLWTMSNLYDETRKRRILFHYRKHRENAFARIPIDINISIRNRTLSRILSPKFHRPTRRASNAYIKQISSQVSRYKYRRAINIRNIEPKCNVRSFHVFPSGSLRANRRFPMEIETPRRRVHPSGTSRFYFWDFIWHAAIY